MGAVCGDMDVMDSPAAFVAYNRKIEFAAIMKMVGEEGEKQAAKKSVEEMTVDELRVHYATTGQSRWENMTEAEKI